MPTLRKTLAASALAPALLAAAPAHADDAALQAQIAALRAQVAAQAEEIAAIKAVLHPLAPASAAMPAVLAEPASAPPDASTAPDTTIGGYGEIGYNAYPHDASRNQADLKRFVLFFGHKFNDKLSLMSEVEFEHAVSSASDKGEAEIEQAYLNYGFSPALSLKAGLFLMPFGFLNRNHEPPAFHGVERNEVERRIIPTTWREGGASLWGSTAFGLAYDVGLTTGFDFAKLDDASAPLLATHQELQLAHAANLSAYAALDYTAAPGVLIGGAVFSGKAGQANAAHRADPAEPDFAGIDGRLTLWEAHARLERGGFDLRALYARGTFAQSAAIDRIVLAYNAANGTDRPLLPSAFYGWLIEGAYTFGLGGKASLSPFVRFERYNTQARLPLGLAPDPANADRVLTGGLSLKPLPDVVVKIDYQKYLENSANDRLNLGLGYQF